MHGEVTDLDDAGDRPQLSVSAMGAPVKTAAGTGPGSDGDPLRVPLTWTDGWLLAAVMERQPGRTATIRDLAHDVDWLNHAIPDFDDVSYGLQRLAAAGLVTRGPAPLIATSTAWDLLRGTPRTDQGPIDQVVRAIGASTDWVAVALGDTAAGRYPGLTEDDWRAAVAGHGRETRRVAATSLVVLAVSVLAWLAGAIDRGLRAVRARMRR